MDTKNYIGDQEIVSAEPVDKDGNPYAEGTETSDGPVKVTFLSGKVEILSSKMMNAVVTSIPIDATELRKKVVTAIAPEILQIFHFWNVKLSDINSVLDLAAISVNESLNAAGEKLWGKINSDLRMNDVDKVLKKSTLSEVLTPPVDNNNR